MKQDNPESVGQQKEWEQILIDEHEQAVKRSGQLYANGYCEGLNDYRKNYAQQVSEGKEIERLNQIIELKEKERREWADMCIKKQKEIDFLHEHISSKF